MKRALALLFPALFATACQSGLDDARPSPELDVAYFRCRVQPVLAKSCGAFACHGDGRRFFHVFARNRMRAQGVENERNAALTQVELQANYDAARALVDPASPATSVLLMKPLDARAGGSFHRGGEIFGGGNVFLAREEADFKTLAAWTNGTKEDPTCVEPGSDQ